MIGRLTGKRRLYGVALAVIALTVGVVVLIRRPAPPATSTTVTNNSARQTYADLYDAAWRQDQGRGNATLTATLITPAMIAALADDTQKSERDEQLYNFTKNLPPDQVGFMVTIDSVAGFFSDSDILETATIADAATTSGSEWLAQTWKPIIGGQRPVNANVAVSSQAGVLIARATNPIDWSILKNLRLVFSDLGDQPIRQFTWAQPGLLTNE